MKLYKENEFSRICEFLMDENIFKDNLKVTKANISTKLYFPPDSLNMWRPCGRSEFKCLNKHVKKSRVLQLMSTSMGGILENYIQKVWLSHIFIPPWKQKHTFCVRGTRHT